jgi:hypothetical protein
VKTAWIAWDGSFECPRRKYRERHPDRSMLVLEGEFEDSMRAHCSHCGGAVYLGRMDSPETKALVRFLRNLG